MHFGTKSNKTTMDGFEAYRYYMALKLHFTTDKYDVFQYDGKVLAKRETFEKRNDKYLFEKMATKKKTPRNMVDFCVANFAHYNLQMMYDQSGAETIHKKWINNKEKITYLFKQDCDRIAKNSENTDPFDATSGMSVLMNLYVNGDVSIESMSILNDFDSYLDRWGNIGFIWTDQFRTIKKLSRFVKYDSEKLKLVYNDLKENTKV